MTPLYTRSAAEVLHAVIDAMLDEVYIYLYCNLVGRIHPMLMINRFLDIVISHT